MRMRKSISGVKMKDSLANSLTKDVLYINEFLDMMRGLQERRVFSEMIYGNKYFYYSTI